MTTSPPVDVQRRTLRGRPRRVLRRLILGLLRLLFGMRLVNVERVPPEGGVLVVSNHLHNADPVLINAAFPRPIHFMAKKEAFVFPMFSWLLRLSGAFPVDRGKADRPAIRRALLVLEQGVALGMFPEGTRSRTRSLQRAHPGAGLIAVTANVPIVPVVITGSERMPFNGSKHKEQASHPMPDPGHEGVRMLFGEPFTIPRERDGRRVTADEATEIIMTTLARMLPSDYHGVYANAVD